MSSASSSKLKNFVNKFCGEKEGILTALLYALLYVIL